MWIRKAVLAAVLVFHGLPSLAADFSQVPKTEPRAIAALPLGGQRIEVLAVGQRARHNTPLRMAYLEECRNMEKVFPGYPQPAMMSVDFRVKF